MSDNSEGKFLSDYAMAAALPVFTVSGVGDRLSNVKVIYEALRSQYDAGEQNLTFGGIVIPREEAKISDQKNESGENHFMVKDSTRNKNQFNKQIQSTIKKYLTQKQVSEKTGLSAGRVARALKHLREVHELKKKDTLSISDVLPRESLSLPYKKLHEGYLKPFVQLSERIEQARQEAMPERLRKAAQRSGNGEEKYGLEPTADQEAEFAKRFAEVVRQRENPPELPTANRVNQLRKYVAKQGRTQEAKQAKDLVIAAINTLLASGLRKPIDITAFSSNRAKLAPAIEKVYAHSGDPFEDFLKDLKSKVSHSLPIGEEHHFIQSYEEESAAYRPNEYRHHDLGEGGYRGF